MSEQCVINFSKNQRKKLKKRKKLKMKKEMKKRLFFYSSKCLVKMFPIICIGCSQNILSSKLEKSHNGILYCILADRNM